MLSGTPWLSSKVIGCALSELCLRLGRLAPYLLIGHHLNINIMGVRDLSLDANVGVILCSL
jgi:hypothetical protein